MLVFVYVVCCLYCWLNCWSLLVAGVFWVFGLLCLFTSAFMLVLGGFSDCGISCLVFMVGLFIGLCGFCELVVVLGWWVWCWFACFVFIDCGVNSVVIFNSLLYRLVLFGLLDFGLVFAGCLFTALNSSCWFCYFVCLLSLCCLRVVRLESLLLTVCVMLVVLDTVDCWRFVVVYFVVFCGLG